MDYLRLFTVRHGETVDRVGYVFNGWKDVELSELGRSQLDDAVGALRDLPFDAVYSSDLRRASYGGRALAAVKDLEAAELPGFREIHFGLCEGLPFKEIEARFPDLAKELGAPDGGDFRFPEGESASEFRRRVEKSLADLQERHPTDRVALFCHSGVGRAILANVLGLDDRRMWTMEQDFACLNVIDLFPGGGARIKVVNGYLGPGGLRSPSPAFKKLAAG